jgi:predicted ArsR family transcriptional regulator
MRYMSTKTAESDREVSYENILRMFRSSDDAALTAGEVADEFNITKQASNYRLKQLVSRGDLVRKRVGASAVVYWIPR